jgi:membrane protease YdiL (CAAX protease family)
LTSPATGRISISKAIGWSIAFLILTFLTGGLLILGAAILITGSSSAADPWLRSTRPESMLLQAIVILVSAGLFTWVIGIRRLGLTRYDLRYSPGRQARAGWVTGLVAGAMTAGLAILISVVAGRARWVSDSGTLADYLLQSAKTLAVLAPAAMSEEILFRGVPLVLLARATGRGSAIVVISVLFAGAHILNPNATLLGLGNIALAGIFIALAFYAPGGIWMAFGAHLGWNSLLAFLDTPVSGLPFDIPVLDYSPGNPTWLTGGSFGPEGGLAATMALTIGILVLARWVTKVQS